jgi:hypothetical protein
MLVAIKLSFDFFYNVQISTNYKKIVLKLFVLSVALARTGINLPVVRDTTPIKQEQRKAWCISSPKNLTR